MSIRLIVAVLQLVAGSGFCLNALMDIKNGDMGSMVLAFLIAVGFFIECLRNVHKEVEA